MNSIRKLEANRKNALRSTGPKTLAGKKTARYNALKHGLLAQEVFIGVGDGKEDPREFQTLLREMSECFQPLGRGEEMLVETIVSCYWRLRRVHRAEVGEIRRSLDSASSEAQRRRLEHFLSGLHLQSMGVDSDGLNFSSVQLDHLIGVLGESKSEIEQKGSLSDAARTRLVNHFSRYRSFASLATHAHDQAQENSLSTDEILAKINVLDAHFRQLRMLATKEEELALGAQMAHLALPSVEASEKILRYESAIERKLYRAWSQLERVQRLRKGEHVPPPINLELNTGARI